MCLKVREREYLSAYPGIKLVKMPPKEDPVVVARNLRRNIIWGIFTSHQKEIINKAINDIERSQPRVS